MSAKPVKFNPPSKVSAELQRMAVAGLEHDYTTAKSNRARLDTGPLCNYRCEFCYYLEDLDKRTPWETVKERIDHIHNYGITEIEFSGGESSMSPDWFKTLDYCKERFSHISCISHGGTFANINHLRKSQEHGLKEILFSLHGSNAHDHEAITGVQGSFDKILKAIDNAKTLGIIVRLNCTVYYRNYATLATEYADLVRNIQPQELNFITLNYWTDSNGLEFPRVPYADVAQGIKACIDKVKDITNINVRYVPYCYFVGYEQYVSGVFQNIYDTKDWNRELYDPTLDTTIKYTHEQQVDHAHNLSARTREIFYHKNPSCAQCKYYHICDGVEREISSTPLSPVQGDKITKINHYR